MDDNAGPPVTEKSPDSAFHASIGAIVLIAVGAILFLDNLGLVPFANIRAYWPLAISAWGVAMLSRSRSGCATVWPWTMIAVGVLITLGNLHLIRADWGNIWPIFLITAGAGMLLKRTAWSWPQSWNITAAHAKHTGRPIRNMDVNSVFGAVNRRIDSPNFERVELNAIFGELKIDMRGATIALPRNEAVVETNAAFGAIKLRVPETWRVVVQGDAVFGAFEDKTLPPRPAPGIDPPTLIVRGNAAFGAVEIEN